MRKEKLKLQGQKIDKACFNQSQLTDGLIDASAEYFPAESKIK